MTIFRGVPFPNDPRSCPGRPPFRPAPSPPVERTRPWSGIRATPALLGVLLLAGALVLERPAEAQSVRTAGPFLLELPAGSRALATGNAFPLAGRDTDAVFVQPGLLNNVTGVTGAAQFWGRGGTLAQLSGGGEWWGGGVALGVRALAYGTQGGNFGLLPLDEGELRRRRPAGAAELQLTGGYGRVIRGVRLGAAGTLLQLQAAGNRDLTGAVNVGAAKAFGPAVVSMAALNLGPGVSSSGAELALAREVTATVTPVRTRPLGPLDVSGSLRVSLLEDNHLTAGGGVELSWWPVQGRTFTLRGGFRSLPAVSTAQPWTAGAGFQGDRLGLDYAVVPFDAGRPSHRIGLHLR